MATGYFQNFDPLIEIQLTGATSHPASRLTCLVDTGSTGFLSVPEASAEALGLVPQDTLEMEYADGSIAQRPACLGIARIDGMEGRGIVALEPSLKYPLLGIRFLQILGLKLLIDQRNGVVELSPASP
ncbi:MAG: hypothetical protein ACREAA_17040 [Candidatus Polarisedimenticolia bacterium]